MFRRLFGKNKDKDSYRIKNDYFNKNYGKDSFFHYLKGVSTAFKGLEDESIPEGSDEELLRWLIERDILSEDEVFRYLSEYLYLDYTNDADIHYKESEVSLLKRIDKKTMERYHLTLVGIEDDKITMGIGSSLYLEVKELLNHLFPQYEVVLSVISYSLFHRLYSLYLDQLSIDDEIDSIDFNEIDENIGEGEDLTSDDSPIVKLVNNILIEAVRQRASDIHIEPYPSKTLIKNRIDGVLIENLTKIPGNYHEFILSRIKIMAKLNIAEQRIPQDGRIKKEVNKKTIDFRVSILPTSHGESAVIRILDKKDNVLLLETLGASTEEKKEIIKGSSLPHGMVLVTGPTGSGKTTTLYAILNEIKDPEKKIITIEDPVEYQLDNAVQIPVNEKAGLTFAKGLRSILRQDPDKIMVGEIRDRETAEIAIQAALTGHLVISTLHANSTVEALGRLSNIGVDSYQFATALNLVVGQRLMRKECEYCLGVGCRECNSTGYLGRTGIYEIFTPTDEIKEMIIQGASPLKIKEKAIEGSMIELETKAVNKVRDRITTIDEYERVIGNWKGEL